MTTLRTKLFAVLLLVTCGACKSECGKAGGADAAPDAVAATDARAPVGRTYPGEVKPNAVAVRYCDALQVLPGERTTACCGGAPTKFFAADCVRVLSASIDDGVVRVSDAAIDACREATKASLEGCLWVTPSMPVPPKECQGIIEGLVAEGGACRSHLDCKSNLHCSTQGTCIKPETAGATCGRSLDTLASSTRQYTVDKTHPICAEHCSLTTHKCAPMPSEGASCFANVNCAPGHLCAEGKCAARTPGAVGEACSLTTCAEGLRCVKGKCAARAKSGEACETDFDCEKGGCTSAGADAGGKTCGMTCSHAADLGQLMQSDAGARSPPRPRGRPPQ